MQVSCLFRAAPTHLPAAERPTRRDVLLQFSGALLAHYTGPELAAKAAAECSTDDWLHGEAYEAVYSLPAAAVARRVDHAPTALPKAAEAVNRRCLLSPSLPHAPAASTSDHVPPPPATAPVLELSSAAELQPLLEQHPLQLIVAHFSTADCPCGAAFRPWLSEATRRFPAALFVHVTAAPAEPAAAPAAACDGVPVSGLLAAAEALGPLPCTLLVRAGQVIDRLDFGSCSEAAAEAGAPVWLPADEAAAAARRLHSAMLGALLRGRLLRADCAAPAEPALVYA